MLRRPILDILALNAGFDAVGVAPVAALPIEVARVKSWIGEGKNAGMGYMSRNLDLRENPGLLVEGARSVIVTLTNYYTARQQAPDIPRIAKYARGKDYHIVVKERLNALLGQLRQESQREITGRCFVDSAPVLEHEWARRAGLGWQGKNTLLIRKGLGSYTFIGIIISDLAFDVYDTPYADSYCGICRRCIDACPTGALSPYSVDARKCISYLTIEHKGEYLAALKRLAGGRIFGCDACQDVCPWNRKVREHAVADFYPISASDNLSRGDWETMDAGCFKRFFKDTPLERTGLEKIRRNL